MRRDNFIRGIILRANGKETYLKEILFISLR